MSETSKKTRADDVYLLLKTEIRSNILPPGLQVPEPELSLRLGVSRTTIREALIRLEADGLVQMIPRRGMRVLPLKAADMKEIYEILTSLESDAAAEIARRRPSRTDLHPLVEATEVMRIAVDNAALEDWAAADDRFHMTMLRLHGNARMMGVVRSLSDQAHRARMATLRLRSIPEQSTREHQVIVDAMLRGDPDEAREAFRAHRVRAAKELLEILEKLPQL